MCLLDKRLVGEKMVKDKFVTIMVVQYVTSEGMLYVLLLLYAQMSKPRNNRQALYFATQQAEQLRHFAHQYTACFIHTAK
jgi:hypothetical protein